MAEVNQEKLTAMLRDFKERIVKLEEKVKALEAVAEDDNNYGEPDEGHPYFGGSHGPAA